MFSDIQSLRSAALAKAQSFIGTTDTLVSLGWGVSGFVFLSPDAMTAVKVHHFEAGHAAEVKAYQWLRQQRITQILGVTVPKLRAVDSDRMLIQMDVVCPPFLLDFAGVKFTDPGFPPDTIAENSRMIEERFGPNAPLAFAIQAELRKLGMFYLDMRPDNLNLQGHPDFKPLQPDVPDGS